MTFLILLHVTPMLEQGYVYLNQSRTARYGITMVLLKERCYFAEAAFKV